MIMVAKGIQEESKAATERSKQIVDETIDVMWTGRGE